MLTNSHPAQEKSRQMSVPINEDFRPQSQVDFVWLSQAWALFTAQPGAWVCAYLLYFLIILALWLLWAIPTGALIAMQQIFLAAINHTQPAGSPQNAYWQFAQEKVIGLILAAVNMVFFGGFYRMALRQSVGERISAFGVFSAFPQALPLLLVGAFMACTISFMEFLSLWLLHLARIAVSTAVIYAGYLAAIPSIILEGLLMFAPLLIVDRKMTVAEAVVGSVRLLSGQRVKGVWFYFVASLVGGLGALLCGIGILATYPMFLISIALGYLALTQLPIAPVSPYNPPQAGVWPPPPMFDDKS